MAVLHIDEFDDSLYSALQERAMRENSSLRDTLTHILEVQLAKEEALESACDSLFGSWEDSRSADEIIAELHASKVSAVFDPSRHVLD